MLFTLAQIRRPRWEGENPVSNILPRRKRNQIGQSGLMIRPFVDRTTG